MVTTTPARTLWSSCDGALLSTSSAIAADAAANARGERDRERRLVEGAGGRTRPRVGGQLAEQAGVRRAMVVLVEEGAADVVEVSAISQPDPKSRCGPAGPLANGWPTPQ